MAKIETTGAGGARPRRVQRRPWRQFGMWSSALVGPALLDSLRKLSPAAQMKNPVMFVVYAGSIHPRSCGSWRCAARPRPRRLHPGDHGMALVHRAVRQLRRSWPKAAASSRRPPCAACAPPSTRACSRDSRMPTPTAPRPTHGAARAAVSQPSGLLRRGDVVLVEAGETIPGDGQVIAGVASVDESAITGESAPVIRESGGDFSSVTGGTRVLSDWIFVRIAADPGESFLDDLHGRRRQAPEDAQRTGADHPAGGPDGGVPAGGGHADAVLDLRGLRPRRRHDGDPPGSPPSCRRPASRRASWPMPPAWPRWPTKRPRDAASWRWPTRPFTRPRRSWPPPNSCPSPPSPAWRRKRRRTHDPQSAVDAVAA